MKMASETRPPKPQKTETLSLKKRPATVTTAKPSVGRIEGKMELKIAGRSEPLMRTSETKEKSCPSEAQNIDWLPCNPAVSINARATKSDKMAKLEFNP